ncbi:MAG: DedA family protein [Planctomycetes bacterium]|nr:DedA family protein [Planctomycetota bacterium]MCB9934816.1 DedA family protein [Planctomycetota bacterium]
MAEEHPTTALTQPSRAPKGGLLGALFWPLRVLKRLYAWVVGWADTRFGTPALVVLSFAEASFFPIPPDPLLIALCLGKRKRALGYGLLCTVASVLGGIAGWYIGQALFGWVVDVIGALGAGPSWFGTVESARGFSAEELAALPRAGEVVFYPDGYFYLVQRKFDENALLAYFSAALSPIPYKVFTIAGGVFSVSLPMLIAGSIAGRGLRFMGLSVLIYIFGDKVKPIIEKYFEWITIGIVVLIVLFFVVLRLVA